MLRVHGPSIRYNGDNGVGEKNICPSIKHRQREITFPVWSQFINLCDSMPVLLRQIAYQTSKVIQRMTPRANVNHSRNTTKLSYFVK